METIFYADLLGTFAFSITGIISSIRHQIDPVGAFFLALVTAMGGGIIRDTLIGDFPFIFHKEIYAASSLVGGTIFYCVYKLNFLPLTWNILLSATLILGLRLWGHRKNIHLPRFHR